MDTDVVVLCLCPGGGRHQVVPGEDAALPGQGESPARVRGSSQLVRQG